MSSKVSTCPPVRMVLREASLDLLDRHRAPFFRALTEKLLKSRTGIQLFDLALEVIHNAEEELLPGRCAENHGLFLRHGEDLRKRGTVRIGELNCLHILTFTPRTKSSLWSLYPTAQTVTILLSTSTS